ncbi:hypothetical protein Dimus_023703 [Dionaea muscipula]
MEEGQQVELRDEAKRSSSWMRPIGRSQAWEVELPHSSPRLNSSRPSHHRDQPQDEHAPELNSALRMIKTPSSGRRPSLPCPSPSSGLGPSWSPRQASSPSFMMMILDAEHEKKADAELEDTPTGRAQAGHVSRPEF